MIKPVGVSNITSFAAVNRTKKEHARVAVRKNYQKEEFSNKDKSFLFSSFISPSKQVSFKSDYMRDPSVNWVCHLDGIVERAGVMVNGSYEKYEEDSIPYKFPSAKDFIKDEKNRDKIVPFYAVKGHSRVENGIERYIYQPERYGFVYIHPNNQYTQLDGRDNIGKKMVDGEVETSKEIEQLVDYFHTQRHYKMRDYLLEKGKMGYEKTRYIQVHYLISNGREEEARELHPDMVDYINEEVAKHRRVYSYNYDANAPKDFRGYLAAGEYEKAVYYPLNLPPSLRELDRYTFDKVVDYIKDENSFIEYENFLKNQTKYIQPITLERNIELSQQNAAFVSTTESGKKRDAKHPERIANRQLVGYRNLMSEFFPIIENAIYWQNQKDKGIAINHFIFEVEKEPIKTELQRSFLYPLHISEEKEDTVLPNCIMLYGKNPFVMQDIIDWTGKVSNANYMKISSQRNIDKMQENILDALELAEEKYEETNKRSIIFVNGMERLLNREYNSQGNIACLKDLMCNASEDYHSTIMFFAKDPSQLDEGALASHRVELKIEVPTEFSYDDSFLGREDDIYDDNFWFNDPYPISGD